MRARGLLAVCHAELGTFAEGRPLGEEGLRMAEAMGHPASRVHAASSGIGMLALRQGDLPRALPLLERALGICQDADIAALDSPDGGGLGGGVHLGGRVTDAVPLLTQAMDQTTAMDMIGLQALCGLTLGEAHLLAGRLEEAHALAEQALAHARHAPGTWSPGVCPAAPRRDRRACALPRRPTRPTAHYRQALALADELGMRPLQAHCHRSLGTLYAANGQREQARTELVAAIDLYRAMDMTFWLPQAEAALVQVE